MIYADWCFDKFTIICRCHCFSFCIPRNEKWQKSKRERGNSFCYRNVIMQNALNKKCFKICISDVFARYLYTFYASLSFLYIEYAWSVGTENLCKAMKKLWKLIIFVAYSRNIQNILTKKKYHDTNDSIIIFFRTVVFFLLSLSPLSHCCCITSLCFHSYVNIVGIKY